MKLDNKEQDAVRQYLLGTLAPEDRPPLEERLLTDAGFYEELLIVEDELIDEYLGGKLSESESRSFETHFMVGSDRPQKARFARALNKYISAVGSGADESQVSEGVSAETRNVPTSSTKPWYYIFLPSQNPIPSYALAAVLLLIAGTVSWLVWKNLNSPTPREPGKILAVSLTPGLTRGEGSEIKKILVPLDVGTLHLQLLLMRDDYPSYKATLVRDDQSEVWTRDHLSALGDGRVRFVDAGIAAGLLSGGDYKVRLGGHLANGGIEEITSYSFRVVR